MLDSKGFDLWADGYDRDVGLSEASNEYPFAGYGEVLNEIYKEVRGKPAAKILDMGFGTAVLSKRLYDGGYEIAGFDFSDKMIAIAQEKMPGARLFRHDFTLGFPARLAGESFDFILCTYAVHHLSPAQQTDFLRECLGHLRPGGEILLGDVAFRTEKELEQCRQSCGDAWDGDEFYPVFEELRQSFPQAAFRPMSFCAGVIVIPAEETNK